VLWVVSFLRTNNTLIQSFASDKANELTGILRSGTLTVSGNVTGQVTTVGVNGQPTELYSDGAFATADGFTLTNEHNLFIPNVTNTSGQLVISTVIRSFLPVTNSFSYDLNGNLLSDGQRTFEYDDQDQLTAVTVSNAWRSEFVYDAVGRRRITRDKSWAAGTWNLTNEVRYVYDGMTVLQERDSNNVAIATYTRGLGDGGGIGGLLALSRAAGTNTEHLYYSSDAGGNITALLNSSGAVVGRYLYDPFGNLIGKWGPKADLNPYRFSSKEIHPNSGLYYYGFRFYDPNLQRWVNQDPLGEAGGMNLYGFVGNSPMGGVDPYGLCKNNVQRATETLQGINSFLNDPLQGPRDWLHEKSYDFGHWLYDKAMAHEPGKPNPDLNGALLASEGLGINAKDNVLRDFIAQGTQVASDGAVMVAEMLATEGLGELGELGQAERSGAAAMRRCKMRNFGSGRLNAFPDPFPRPAPGFEEVTAEDLGGLTIKDIQDQGREFSTDTLQVYEWDPNQPAHVRGWLRQERFRVEKGLQDKPDPPPGYQQSHLSDKPAREGYGYNNSRLNLESNNKLEESVRRRLGRP
jgi:RHS repeat-associated protein